jgi:GNAT superfamily N-acetyltransferase
VTVTNAELSREVDRATADYFVQRFSGPGNPIGTQFLRIGDMVATKVPFLKQNELMNSVHHLEDPAALPEVLAFYAATGQTCWVPVAPYTPASVTDALIAAGFRVERYQATLVAEPVPDAKADAAVREIGRDELGVFLDTMNVGFDSPAATLDNLRRNQSFWCDMPNWHLYLAGVDGAPAGAAVLSIHHDIGYLAAGSVLPQFRGRGLHAALIAARLIRCRERRCRVVTVGTAWGTQSQRNLQRAGFALAHVRSIWTNGVRVTET